MAVCPVRAFVVLVDKGAYHGFVLKRLWDGLLRRSPDSRVEKDACSEGERVLDEQKDLAGSRERSAYQLRKPSEPDAFGRQRRCSTSGAPRTLLSAFMLHGKGRLGQALPSRFIKTRRRRTLPWQPPGNDRPETG